MDGKVATLAGVAALVAAPAVASVPTNTPAVPVAASYAELLDPIPNAAERLQLADAQLESDAPTLIPAQWGRDHHHHHHHHAHYSRYWYQQHGYYWYGGRWTLRPRHHHHHHHHHNNNY